MLYVRGLLHVLRRGDNIKRYLLLLYVFAKYIYTLQIDVRY